MNFLKHKLAVAGAILSVVVSVSLLGNSLIYGFTEDYKSWKQYGSSWSDMHLGTSSDTVLQSGCATTAAAILMVHSGSVDSEDFNPGVIVEYLNENGGLNSYGILNWYVLSEYAPDFKYVTDVDNILHGTTQAEKAQEIKDFLDAGYYVMVCISNSKTTHFVAVDSVNGARVTMMDPGSTATSLFDKYDVNNITQVRLFRGKYSSGNAVPAETAPAPETTAVQETAPVVLETIATETAPETAPETESPDLIIEEAPADTPATTEAPVTTQETTTTTIATVPETQVVTTVPETQISTEPAPEATAPPVTTAKPVTTTEIIITTKATTVIEAVFTEPIAEVCPETIAEPITEEDIFGQIEVIIQDAPETAPVGSESSEEIRKTKTLYIPEEQAEASLIEIKQQHVLMSIRFTIKTNLNLRAAANTDSEILTVIPANTSLNVVEVDDNFKWGRVLYDGHEGWIALNFAEL